MSFSFKTFYSGNGILRKKSCLEFFLFNLEKENHLLRPGVCVCTAIVYTSSFCVVQNVNLNGTTEKEENVLVIGCR